MPVHCLQLAENMKNEHKNYNKCLNLHNHTAMSKCQLFYRTKTFVIKSRHYLTTLGCFLSILEQKQASTHREEPQNVM